VTALRLAPLSLVQAASAGGIGVLALLVDRAGAHRLTRFERAGVAAALAGLALLGVSLVGSSNSGALGAARLLAFAAVVVGAAMLAGSGPSRGASRSEADGARAAPARTASRAGRRVPKGRARGESLSSPGAPRSAS
jgi:hypothetical protein